MLQALLLTAIISTSADPVGPRAEAAAGSEVSAEIVSPGEMAHPSAPTMEVVTVAQLRSSSREAGEPQHAEEMQRTDAGRFVYNVAVGVAVTVISALILRAIL